MMIANQASLRKQIEIVFNQLKEELSYLSSGVVFIQIRNNVIGKFGIKQDHYDSSTGQLLEGPIGLSELQWKSFKQLAIDSLNLKKKWTHGEISYEFTIKRGMLCTSIQMESNYNMANLINS